MVKRGSWVVYCVHRYLSCVNKLGRNWLMLFFSADRAKSSFNGARHAIPIKWTIEEHLFKLLDHWFQIIKFYSLVQQKPFWWLIDLFIGSNWIAEVGTSALLNVASMTINNVFFLLLAHSAHSFLRTCALPHTPTDGVARIFPLTPMPRPGIKLMSAQLHLFEGP